MDSKYLILILFLLFPLKDCYEERSALDLFIVPLRQFRSNLLQYLLQSQRSYGRSARLRSEKRRMVIPASLSFPCNISGMRSSVVPDSVHRLRPGDIDIIGGMGDSLTAGYGLTGINLLDIFVENRDKSFSMGGAADWRTYLTLPNIIKEFNPNLFGYSTKPSYTFMRESQFNVAEGGAVSHNMPYMSKILVKRIVNDPRVKLDKHWKMITILIGDNDFCSEICYTSNTDVLLRRHEEDMVAVLRTLRDNLPRTFVNLIPPIDVGVLLRIRNRPRRCELIKLIECPCMMGPTAGGPQRIKYYLDFMKRWQKLDMEIADYAEFHRVDFTVVAHPMFLDSYIPEDQRGNTDLTYMGVDCFHFSQKGNALVANSLWNSLLEPVGQKHNHTESFYNRFVCPTEEHPYLYTRKNS